MQEKAGRHSVQNDAGRQSAAMERGLFCCAGLRGAWRLDRDELDFED